MPDEKSQAESDTVAVGDSGPVPPARSSTDVLSAAGDPSSAPQRLAGRYELLALLGVGGMGAVYRAKDLELDEMVALKMLRRELVADAGLLARFRQEVKLARRVTHRNVARTFDIGEHEGEKFLTMELVEGESLAALLARQGRLPLARVVALAEAICSGLAAAHAAGIVHRDLKPENVLLAADGRVVLTDFGIARAASDVDGAFVKTMGVPLGTPAYMAPEQVEGSKEIDARADIYALGAMLYELLTGEPPWRGDTVYAVAAMRLVHPPPDPRARLTDLPDAAAQVTMRCMARKPADRFASATDVATALAALTLPAPAASPHRPEHAGRSFAPTVTPAGEKTVAVLPFRNGGPSDDEYLADGLTDDLIDNLSMTKGLRVRSRGVVMGLKGVDRDPRDLGGSLGVQVVVEGSVRRAGDRLRVNARVVSVSDGFQLWAKRFDCPSTEFFAVGDEMVKAVSLALTVESHTPVREAKVDPAAVDLYLRARHHYFQGWSVNLPIALDLFEQALRLAPDDPVILSGYAMALARQYSFNDATEDAAGKSRRAAERALAAAPHMGEARLALASCLLAEGDNTGAAREARQALASSPGLADAHELCGRLLLESGALAEGLARVRSAIALEPRLILANWMVARTHMMRGELREAVDVFREEPTAHGQAVYWLNRARIALWTRDHEFARQWLPRLKARGDIPPGAMAMLGLLVGEVPAGAATMPRLEQASAATGPAMRRRAFFSQVRAELHGFKGDAASALQAVVDGEAAALFDLAWLDGCPLLAVVRAEPGYAALHGRIEARAKSVREAFGLR